MFLINRLMFNQDAAENGGGATDVIEAPEKVVDEVVIENKEIETVPELIVKEPSNPLALTPEQLSSWGFESVEQMNAHFEKVKLESRPDTEKQKELDIENANFRAFAIKEGHMTDGDFKTYETLKNTNDRELVYKESFLPEFKADNPEIDDEDLEEAARDQFDTQYPENKTKRIEREAAEIRKETFDKYENAQSDYATDKKYQGGKDGWVSFVKKTLESALTDELIFNEGLDGEDDVSIKVPLSVEDKAEIAKKVLTPKRYSQYINGTEEERKELAATLSERAQTLAIAKYNKVAVKSAIERGIKIGSDRVKIGATNPFPLVDKTGATQGQAATGETIEQSHARLKDHLNQYK